MTERSLRDNILAAQVVAALQGHDLGPFEPTEEPGVPKFQAFCHSCGKSVYVSNVTVYSILGDSCPGQVRLGSGIVHLKKAVLKQRNEYGA